jgi:hypothetical protein
LKEKGESHQKIKWIKNGQLTTFRQTKKKLVLVSLGLSGREECHESVLNFHLIKEKID